MAGDEFFRRMAARRIFSIVLIAAVFACRARQEPGSGHLEAPVEPRRIVSVSAELTDLIIGFGLAPRIVGADSASVSLPGVDSAVDLGDSASVRGSAILALRPDFVVALEAGGWSPYQAQVEEQGIPVHLVAPTDSNQVIATIRELGGLLGREAEADAMVETLTDAISQVATERDGKPRLSVAWILQRDPLLVVGSEGMLHEMLELAGGEIAFHEIYGEKIEVTLEALAAIGPDVILDSTPWGRHQPIAIGARYEALPATISELPTLDLLDRIRFLHGVLYPDPG